MAPPQHLQIDPVEHASAAVRRMGFELDDPYVEEVWIAAIGPTCTLLLRRLPDLWRHEVPAQVDAAELAGSLGLSRYIDKPRSQIWHTFERLRQFRLATPIRDGRVGVFTRVPLLSDRLLARVPEWTARRHAELLESHTDRLAHEPDARAPTPPRPVAQIRARLDQLEHPSPSTGIDAPGLAR